MSTEASIGGRRKSWLRSLAPLVLVLCVYVVWPAQAFAQALLRIVHAVPGAGNASLSLTGPQGAVDFGTVGFGQFSGFHSVPTGPVKWILRAPDGKELANGNVTLPHGTYTGILMYRGSGMKQMGVMLHLYRDHSGEPGKTLIRVIHSAPEFGNPSLMFDSKTVATNFGFMQATPYLTVPPGVHSLAATAPGHSAPMLSVKGVKLQSGVAYTEIVVGTRGQRVRVVTVVDRGAPLTRPAPKHHSAKRQRVPVDSKTRAGAWIVVKPGDSLWKIAAGRIPPGSSNEEIWREVVAIWDENAGRIGTGDPNVIFPGTRLRMPKSPR